MNKHEILHPSTGFFKQIIEFFFPPIVHQLHGKLIVSSFGVSEFTLKHCPKDVFVYFDDDCHIMPCAPCDPGQEDVLDWQIIHHKHHFTLIINWDVSSMRTICWKVCS